MQELINHLKMIPLYKYLTLFALILFFIGLIVFIVRLAKLRQKHFEELYNNISRSHIITVDLNNNLVTILLKENLSKRIQISYKRFLKRYNISVSSKLNSWIKLLVNSKTIPDENKTISFTDSSPLKKTASYVFTFNKIIRNRRIIRFQETITYIQRKEFNLSQADYYKKLYESKDNSSILLALITFYTKSPLESNKDYELDDVTFSKFSSIISIFCDESHLIQTLSKKQMSLTITNYNKENDRTLNNIIAEFKKQYAISHLKEESFHICYTEQKFLDFDYKYLLKKLREQSRYHIESKNFTRYSYTYSSKKNYTPATRRNLVERIDGIFNSNALSFAFIPHYNVMTTNIDSYYLYVRLKDEEDFTSYHDFLNKCYEVSRESDLIKILTNKIINSYKSVNNSISHHIYLDITPPFVQYINNSKIISHFLEENNIYYHFIMKSSHIVTYSKKYTQFSKIMSALIMKTNGRITFSVDLTSSEPLSSEIEMLVNSYQIDAKLFNDLYLKDREHISLISTIDRIYNHTTNLIAYNISNWKLYETLVCSKIRKASGAIFGHIDSIINDFTPEKNLHQMIEIKNRHFVKDE